jgi:hypothetical protein
VSASSTSPWCECSPSEKCFIADYPSIGAVVGFIWNFGNEALYLRYKEQKGVEARLYVPMVAGVTFAMGCFIFAFTSVPGVHWIGACFGIVIIIGELRIRERAFKPC